MGEDAGWRGNLNVEASLRGLLGAAKLTTTVRLEELRRSEFVPVQTMEVRAECRGTLDVTTAVVKDPDCAVPTPFADGAKISGRLVAIADRVDLSELSDSSKLASGGVRVGMTNVPNAWLLDWARLFSQRIPAGEHPEGTVAGSVALEKARVGQAARWEGEVHGEIVGLLPWMREAESGYLVHTVTLTRKAGDEGFVLAPVNLTPPGKGSGLVMGGVATRAGYTLRFAGTATEAQVQGLRALAPPLGDGLEEVVRGRGGGAARCEAAGSEGGGYLHAGMGCGADVRGGWGGGGEAEAAVARCCASVLRGGGLEDDFAGVGGGADFGGGAVVEDDFGGWGVHDDAGGGVGEAGDVDAGVGGEGSGEDGEGDVDGGGAVVADGDGDEPAGVVTFAGGDEAGLDVDDGEVGEAAVAEDPVGEEPAEVFAAGFFEELLEGDGLDGGVVARMVGWLIAANR